MTNFIDDLLSAKQQAVSYVLSFTEVDPANGTPRVHCWSGMLDLVTTPISSKFFMGPARYVSRNFKKYYLKGHPLAELPDPADWVDQLMIEGSATGNRISWGRHSNFGVEVGDLVPDKVFTQANFPGFSTSSAGILIGQTYLGMLVVVVELTSAGFGPDNGP